MAVAVKRTFAPQSVAKASLLGPSISLITNLKSLTGIGVIPSACKKAYRILERFPGIPETDDDEVYRILSPDFVNLPVWPLILVALTNAKVGIPGEVAVNNVLSVLLPD